MFKQFGASIKGEIID
ncbi:Protein of unknown function [Bacillus cereus]|nr:Protein of unknown function [Bacillus cereus]SCN33407.1 Protein of unknown function [Bacillus cereus]